MTIEETIQAAVDRAVDRKLASVDAKLDQLLAGQAPRWLTVAEAAEALSCHQHTVRRMVKKGQLTYKRVGNGVRIDARSLQGAGGRG